MKTLKRVGTFPHAHSYWACGVNLRNQNQDSHRVLHRKLKRLSVPYCTYINSRVLFALY